VDGLGILTQPHARLVTEQPQGGGGQVIAQQLLHRGVVVEVADLQLGRPDLAVAERAPVLAELLDRLVAPASCKRASTCPGCRLGAVAQLDLQLAEPVDHPPALDHLHLIVDHLGQPLAGGVAQLDRLPHRPQPGDWLQRRAADVDPQQRGGPLGYLAWLAVEGLLLPHQHPGGLLSLCRLLHRPALVVAIPQALPPARQAQIGRIPVGRGVPPLRLRLGEEPVVWPTEPWEPESGRRDQLRFPFQHVSGRSPPSRFTNCSPKVGTPPSSPRRSRISAPLCCRDSRGER
jgi:hypothetical protein